MNDFLNRMFYGNTIEDWLFAMMIMLGSVVVARVVYWVFSTILQALTARTETRLDDLLVDLLKKPLVLAMVLGGIWIGFSTLALPDGLTNAIGRIVQFLFTLLTGWTLSRIMDAIYQEYLIPFAEQSDNDLDDHLVPLLQKGTRLIIWSMAIIIGLDSAGYDVGALIAGLGIGGLALAMAAKDTVANVFGGITIFADRPFTIGDRVKISGYDGTIKEIGVRSTRLVTMEGRTVTIPNSKFADSPVENISWEPSRKVIVELGLTYDTTPEQMAGALALLKQIALDTPGTENEATARFNDFGPYSLNITFIYYIRKTSDIPQTQSDVNLAILREFNARGLQFAFPTQTIHTAAASHPG